MITRLSHATLFVKDQDESLSFYRDKLGFEVRTDMTLEGFRWLTVGPKGQDDVEIVLIRPCAGPMMDQETVDHIEALLDKGALGCGVFATENCRATYDELKGRGVNFINEPQDRPYGVEALFRDNSGNWFSLTERKAFDAG